MIPPHIIVCCIVLYITQGYAKRDLHKTPSLDGNSRWVSHNSTPRVTQGNSCIIQSLGIFPNFMLRTRAYCACAPSWARKPLHSSVSLVSLTFVFPPMRGWGLGAQYESLHVLIIIWGDLISNFSFLVSPFLVLVQPIGQCCPGPDESRGGDVTLLFAS